VIFTSGAYLALILSLKAHAPLIAATLLAMVACSVLGCVVELAVYHPVRRRGGSPLMLLLCSLGIYIVLQNTISMLFGDDLKTLPDSNISSSVALGTIRITPVQITIACASVVLIVAAAMVLKATRIGRAIRAVASDPELAGVSGVRSDRVILASFAAGSALAGLAGVLVAMDTAMTPDMGLNALLMAAAAMILGGVESIPGIALGALLVGLTQHFGVWLLGSQWQDAIAFAVLLIALAIRPQGLLGKRAVRATV
jgi:branched-chain amino acid transport system permease protein